MKYTSSNLDFVIQELKKVDLTTPKRITITEWKEKRSDKSNRAYQRWYPQMSDALGMTIPEATRYIKLMFGLPILLADEYFGDIFTETLISKGFFNADYEQQLLFIERFPVTRLFDNKMHKRLRDDLQAYFASMGYDLSY